MGLRPLHLLGSPVLREESAAVETVDDSVRQLIADLYETMDAAEGVGLAANQVGVAQRVAVVGVEDDRFVLVNPVIITSEGKDKAEEFRRQRIGRSYTALIESQPDKKTGLGKALTGNYLKVLVEAPEAAANTLRRIRITGVEGGKIHGTLEE